MYHDYKVEKLNTHFTLVQNIERPLKSYIQYRLCWNSLVRNFSNRCKISIRAWLKSLSSVPLISRYILRLGQAAQKQQCPRCPNRKMYLEIRDADEGAFDNNLVQLHFIALWYITFRAWEYHEGWFNMEDTTVNFVIDYNISFFSWSIF